MQADPQNYDAWFDYSRLEEDAYRSARVDGGEDPALERVRDVYERAVAQVPPGHEKRYWRRYIFLWLNYALFEEVDAQVCMFAFPVIQPANSIHLPELQSRA